MELLKDIDILKAEIIKDAQTKADRTINNAKKEIVEIDKKVEIDIEDIEKRYVDLLAKDSEKKTNKIFASIEIDLIKKKWGMIGEILKDIFDNIKNGIKKGEIINYKDFVFYILKDASATISDNKYILEINKNDLLSIGRDSLLNLKLPKGKIEQIIEKDIEGFMLYSWDRKKVSYMSIDRFVEQLEELERNNIYKLLKIEDKI